MKHTTGIMLSLVLASGVASNMAKVTKSTPSKVTDAKKPFNATAKSAVVASVATKTAIPLVMARKHATNSSVLAARTKRAAAATALVHSAPRPMASTHRPVVASLSATVKVHLRAFEPLLPVGEGAYQSAKAVAQRTVDSNRDCE